MADRPVIYTEVAEYHGTQANNIGKTVYNYDNFGWAPSGMFISGGGAMVPKYHIYNCNYWNNPVLVKQTDYKAIQTAGAISYQKKKETSNVYTVTNLDDVAGLHVQRLLVLPQKGILGPGVDVERWAALYQNMNVYTFSDYHIPVGVKNLTSTTESLYNDDGSTVVNTVSYSYNAKQYLSQKTSNTSDGAAISTQITYPFDYTGNAVLNQMTDPSRNMLNFPIEQNEFRNSTPIKGVRTNYFNFQSRWSLANPMILPQTVDVKKGMNAYETRLVYQDYDKKGNLTSVAKQGDLSHAYIWDYNYSYPVAEISTPFGSSSVAYTSFEADGLGNWIVPSTLRDNTYAFTGKQSYNLSNGAISIAQNGLDPTIWYTLSYWSKNGMYQCPDASSVKTGSTINGWTYYEARVFVSSSGTTSISGSGLIDEVRLYPEKAQMTTYTYAPLVGVTSSCDASNKVTYYEYDGFGRLKLIRDINGNILKTFKYQYQTATP
jgi:YD repeat-containing protein